MALGLTVLAGVAGAESVKTNAACDPKNGQSCGMSADAKTASPAAPAIAKPVAPAPAAPTEAKPTAPAPAASSETKPVVAEAASLTVEEIAVATSVENHAPVGAAESFPASTEKLFCYSKVAGGKEGDTIVHRWSHDGKMISEVTLKVNGSPWRTFSTKALDEDAAGSWTVEVLQNNNVLKTTKFEVVKAEAKEAVKEPAK